MDKITIENRLRHLGSSGLLKGHWDCIDILALCADGVSTADAVAAVAVRRGVSVRVMRDRIGRLMIHMERTDGAAFSLLWAEGEERSVASFLARALDFSRAPFCGEDFAVF